LTNDVKHVFISIENKRNVLLIGKESSGLTQVARWISDYYSSFKQKNKSFCIICTPETTIADLIRRLIPLPKNEIGNEIIIFKEGPLTTAVIEGYCGVLDNIHFAPAKVSERLNSLLDPKESSEDFLFEIPEISKNPIIKIHEDFRLIATASDEYLDSMSPALLNRFTIINLDDQLQDLTEDKFFNFIKFIFDNHFKC
jgi:midasin (ATPase involved in ribosome maturation)